MDFPLCSVVIPCGRQHRLPELLDALGKQTILPAQMEVIVVTPLKPSNRLEHSPPGIFWVETGQLFPPGRMRNLGAAVARGRILLFLDDDCIPPAEWAAHMQDNIDSKPGLGAVGCRVICRGDGFWNRCADYVLFAAAQQVKSGPRFLMSAAMAVRRDSFDAVRGFDESLRASEDWDFCIRLAQAGWTSHYDASLMVRHDHGRGGFRAIMGQCLASGWESGLTVQTRHATILGHGARILTASAHSWLYPLVAIPYALVLTMLQAWDMRAIDPRWPLFLPFLAAGRITYQIGVWRRIRGGNA